MRWCVWDVREQPVGVSCLHHMGPKHPTQEGAFNPAEPPCWVPLTLLFRSCFGKASHVKKKKKMPFSINVL